MVIRRLACTVIAISVSLGVRATAAEYHVDTRAENVVRFISDAPVEDFEGVTSNIDGYVLWKGGDLSAPGDLDQSEFYFEVPLATLKTGINLRDSHMRENYLETADFPYTSYTGKLKDVKSTDSGTYQIAVAGDFTLHGVTRAMDIDCVAVPDGNGFAVSAQFSVKLTAFDIEVPSLMFLKINEEIQLELEFHLKDAVQAK